jgi:hypothetical protein
MDCMRAEELHSGHTVVFIFNSIHRVLKAEKLLHKEEVVFRLIPTPRPLVSDCGMAISTGGAEVTRVNELFRGNAIRPAHVYARAADGAFEPVEAG